jgi:hypothetical protein
MLGVSVRHARRLLAALVVSILLLSVSAFPASASFPPPANKQGIASRTYLLSAPGKLRNAGATWTYTWTTRVPFSKPGLEVVPMVRDARGIDDVVIARMNAGRVAGYFRYLLGFNEPDHANQANMTPTQAADLWPKLMATGLKLGSPAPAVPTNGWLAQFMSIATKRHLRVDFIALHFYADITNPRAALARMRTQIAQVRAKYHRPVWITELGIIDTRTHPGPAQTNIVAAQRFMRSATTMLDKLSYVQRYAWMTDLATQPTLKWSTLYNTHRELTAIGRTYRDLH